MVAADTSDGPGTGQDQESEWRKLNRQRKKKAGLFVCVTNLADRLVVSKIGVEAGLLMIGSCLELS